jgi:co-chaperonin GroES (HSP10)
MSIDKIQAVGYIVMVVRDTPEKERGGLVLPELSQKKPNTGKILSVGEQVKKIDANIKPGRTAIFGRQTGTEIHIFDTSITILNAEQAQVLGVL